MIWCQGRKLKKRKTVQQDRLGTFEVYAKQHRDENNSNIGYDNKGVEVSGDDIEMNRISKRRTESDDMIHDNDRTWFNNFHMRFNATSVVMYSGGMFRAAAGRDSRSKAIYAAGSVAPSIRTRRIPSL